MDGEGNRGGSEGGPGVVKVLIPCNRIQWHLPLLWCVAYWSAKLSYPLLLSFIMSCETPLLPLSLFISAPFYNLCLYIDEENEWF